ncbi:hypothetical protein ACJX0J_031683 [Zea mays]
MHLMWHFLLFVVIVYTTKMAIILHAPLSRLNGHGTNLHEDKITCQGTHHGYLNLQRIIQIITASFKWLAQEKNRSSIKHQEFYYDFDVVNIGVFFFTTFSVVVNLLFLLPSIISSDAPPPDLADGDDTLTLYRNIYCAHEHVSSLVLC